MSYLKIVRQISSLVTPDRYLARTSASVKKEEVSMSYVHNLNSDERHAGSIKHRAKRAPRWKGPEARLFGGAEQPQLAWRLAGGMLGRPPAGPQPGREAAARDFGVLSSWGAWVCKQKCSLNGDREDRQTVLGLLGTSRAPVWGSLGSLNISPAWCPSAFLEN